MRDNWYNFQSGVPSFDTARYSAPPVPLERVELLRDGLSLLIIPPQPKAEIVQAMGPSADVLIRLIGPIRRFERSPSPSFGTSPLHAGARAGSFIVVPRGLSSDWHIPGGQPSVAQLHVSTALRDGLADEMEDPTAARGTLRPRLDWHLPAMERLFDRLLTLGPSTQPLDRLELQGLGLLATAGILRANGAALRSQSAAMTPARLRRVRAYVEENLSGEVCLEDMASCVGLSPSHFSRAFRAETGQSPYAFVLQTRVDRVKDHLRLNRRTLAEIALDCGFASQSHMTETFRRATGLPPARWLREHGGEPGPASKGRGVAP
jgi:AraC family transcriptional regulator